MKIYCAGVLIAAGVLGCKSNGRGPGPGDDLSVAGPYPDLYWLGSSDLANGGCGTATYEAKQAPAALLVLLDRSASMADGNKFVFAAQAIVQAIDQDIFDTMSVGLMAAPSGANMAPACIQNIAPGTMVSCQAPPFPQIDLQPAGKLKSNDVMGVRHDIKSWLGLPMNAPDQGVGDATPMYGALQSAIGDLQAWPKKGKRLLMVVTDGSWDCTQYSNRPGYSDCNCCDHEWEKPQNVVSLLNAANTDPNAPIETFIVGVPGADTVGNLGAGGCMSFVNCGFPPYSMRAALSAIAAAGSPNNIPANCTGKTFVDNSPDPATSCHFDMTKGNFNTMALATAISQVRGKVLGCVFDLPPVDGGMVDPTQVNVNYSVAGGAPMDLFKRADPNNPCVNTGCWDFTVDGRIQIVGKACDDIKNSMNTKVQIVLGCATRIG